jgi:phage/plasmid-like protein (TIGR03299 family)
MHNTQQILEENGLDWNVVKKPLLYAGECTLGANNGLHSTDYYGIVREDTGEVFATVKEAYTPTQNHTIIETMQEIAGQNNLEIVKAVPFNEGRKVMIQMKRPNNHVVIGGQDTEQYIYAINSHDGSSSLKFGFMNKVIFCQNQFGWLNSNAISGYRHTQSIQDKVKELPTILNFTAEEEKIAELQHFSSQSISRDTIDEMLFNLTKIDRVATLREMRDNFSTRSINIFHDLEACVIEETSRVGLNKWGLFNGVTKYTTHMKSAPLRDNGRQESIVTGSAGKMNEKAFNFLKAY